jgi:two-component system sensor histidine kinase KdpD
VVVLVVLLAVFLAATAVLAVRSRTIGREARAQAAETAERAREAKLVAAVARRLLHGGQVTAQLPWIGARVAEALGARSARVEFASVPSPREGEKAVRLPLEEQSGWLYVEGGADGTRVAEPLAGIIDVALERHRLDAREADAEAARRGNLAKTAVLHLVSHDLRPMIHAVAEAVDLMGDGNEQSQRARMAVARAARLIDDLVDLSRMESGTLRTRPEPVDLRAVVAAAVEDARAAHDGHPIAITIPDDLPAVYADREQLERVVANLIDNAVRFSPPGEAVRVTGGRGGGKATVRVIDHGPGIPAAQRARVFEPFFQGRPSDVGGGLGLAVSRGYVEANGGRLALQAGTNGETAFAVTLPLAEA